MATLPSTKSHMWLQQRWKAILMVFGLMAAAIVVLWETTSIRAPDTRSNVELQLHQDKDSVIQMGQDIPRQKEIVAIDQEESIAKENNYFNPDENNNFQREQENNPERTKLEESKEPIEQIMQMKERKQNDETIEKLDNNEDEYLEGFENDMNDHFVGEKNNVKEPSKRKVSNIMENIKKSIQGRKPLKQERDPLADEDEESEMDENKEVNNDENNIEDDNNRNDDVEGDRDEEKHADDERKPDGVMEDEEKGKYDDKAEIKEDNDQRDDNDDEDNEDLANMPGVVMVDENSVEKVVEKKTKRTRYANFFSEQPVGFNDVELIKDKDLGIEDGIPLDPFIKACYGFMPMIDFFGVSFSKAKSDLEKNIGRIKERYESDPKRFTVVQRMLAAEFDVRDDDQLATKGVRWIKRSMEFTKELLLNIQQGLSLSQAANAAYDLTLVKYHNWFIQKIFRVGFATLGNRQDLIVKMSYHPEFAGEPEFEKVLYEDMDKYLDDLQKTLDIIKKFFDKYDIEN